MKIETEKEKEIALRFLKIGIVAIMVTVTPILYTVWIITDIFSGIDLLLVIILWAMVWVQVLDCGARPILKFLFKMYNVEEIE